jgi:hypothetical protein
MRYPAVCLLITSGITAGCSGANNSNSNLNGLSNNNLRNVNVSRPETSPGLPPAAVATAANNGKLQPSSMANEKVMTPAETPDKRVPPINRPVPELKGTPLKKP